MSDIVPAERDATGLSLPERRLLQEIAVTGDFKKAARNVGMTAAQVRRLLNTDPAFKEEYDKMFSSEDLKATEAELQIAVQDIAEVFNDAKTAEMDKTITVECPHCKTKFQAVVRVADHAIRMRAAETLAKITRMWKDQKDIKVSGTVALVNMSAAQYLAFQRLQMGLSVPDHVYRSLQEFARDGGLDLPPNGGNIVEGSYREVTDADNSAPE